MALMPYSVPLVTLVMSRHLKRCIGIVNINEFIPNIGSHSLLLKVLKANRIKNGASICMTHTNFLLEIQHIAITHSKS